MIFGYAAQCKYVAVSGVGILLALVMASCLRRPPELSKAEAWRRISGTPEFNLSRTLVSVDTVGWGSDESQPDFVLAQFTFRYRHSGSSATIKASAQFRYQDAVWHLIMFRYDDSGRSVGVNVGGR